MDETLEYISKSNGQRKMEMSFAFKTSANLPKVIWLFALLEIESLKAVIQSIVQAVLQLFVFVDCISNIIVLSFFSNVELFHATPTSLKYSKQFEENKFIIISGSFFVLPISIVYKIVDFNP